VRNIKAREIQSCSGGLAADWGLIKGKDVSQALAVMKAFPKESFEKLPKLFMFNPLRPLSLQPIHSNLSIL